jgi:hypothetical protein
MPVPRYRLRTKLTDPFSKCFYQLGFGPFARVRSPQGVNTPAFGLAVRHQGSYADDLVERVFGESGPQSFPHLRLGGCREVKHPGGCRKIRHGFEVPDYDVLFQHWVYSSFGQSVCLQKALRPRFLIRVSCPPMLLIGFSNKVSHNRRDRLPLGAGKFFGSLDRS